MHWSLASQEGLLVLILQVCFVEAEWEAHASDCVQQLPPFSMECQRCPPRPALSCCPTPALLGLEWRQEARVTGHGGSVDLLAAQGVPAQCHWHPGMKKLLLGACADAERLCLLLGVPTK